MADRNVESDAIGVPQLDETLEVLLLQTIEEAQQRMDDGEDVVPFTALLVGESVFEETHTGTTDECFETAQSTIEGAEGARAYAFCYDGYVETDDGTHDALIAEGGVPSADKGFAVGQLYTVDDEGSVTFESEPVYIGPAPNFMIALRDADEYTDDEIDEKYRGDVDAEAAEAAVEDDAE